ncbi:MAG: type 4a pilus biogenesis protein PilO [Acidimicrobiales bacterium]
MTPRAVVELAGPPLAALALWFGVGWLPPAMSGDGERLVRAEAERAGLLAEVAAARELPAAAGPAEERLSAAAAAVPAEPQISEFVRLVGQLATASGAAVDQMSPLTVSSDTDAEATAQLPPGTSSITLSIGTRGTYEALMGFLDQLRHQPRLVVVDLIDLTADENDAGTLVANLEVRIFTTAALVNLPAPVDPAPDAPVDAAAGAPDGTGGAP